MSILSKFERWRTEVQLSNRVPGRVETLSGERKASQSEQNADSSLGPELTADFFLHQREIDGPTMLNIEQVKALLNEYADRRLAGTLAACALAEARWWARYHGKDYNGEGVARIERLERAAEGAR